MKRRVKPYNELSRWQRNRRLRQIIEESDNEQSFYLEEESCVHLVNKDEKEKNQMENRSISVQYMEVDDILQDLNYSSDSNDCDKDIEEETGFIGNILHNEQYLNNTTNSVDRNETFLSELQLWAIKNNISHVAMSQLLKLYKKYHSNTNISNDARVFLNTPRQCVVNTCGTGEYLYYGLRKALVESINQNAANFANNIITVDINIDGLPISKSTNRQLWPIQGRIVIANTLYQPFIIGIYHGMNKPSSVDEFLNDFVNEFCILQDEGFDWNGKNYFLRIRAVTCDAPTRSFIKCVKNCNALWNAMNYGCERCTIKGTYDNKVVFVECNCERRTDHSFRNKLDPHHHTGVSPLERLGIDMISTFALDYMHLVLLGVMKRLLFLWMKGIKECRISSRNYKILNERLRLNQRVPCEISRKPRSNLQDGKPRNFVSFFCIMLRSFCMM